VVDVFWDHRILTVCMRRSEKDGINSAQNGTHIFSTYIQFLTSGLLCHSPVLCLLRSCCLTSSEPYIATPCFVFHAPCMHTLLLPVFKLLCHMCHMSSEPHGAENTVASYTHTDMLLEQQYSGSVVKSLLVQLSKLMTTGIQLVPRMP